VAPGGDDSNDCLNPATPCATINGVLNKPGFVAGDTTLVAEGTYVGIGDEVVLLDKDVTLSGGWDGTFTTQSGISTIDGEDARRGMTVNSGVMAIVERFTVQNGSASDGGGISNYGTMTLNSSTVSGNIGGGIYNGYGSTLILNGSAVSDNTGSGINNQEAGTLTLHNSTVSGNTGGGIFNNGTLILNSSTVSGNSTSSPYGGGGIYNSGTLTLNNSTVSGNTASNAYYRGGGGIINYYGGTLTLNNSTVSGNSTSNAAWGGGGILQYAGTVTLQNSILAGNTATNSSGPDCGGALGSSGYNLIGDTAGCRFSSSTGDLTNIDAKLGPLQDNGGPTETHALLPGSPAIDAGDDSACPATDQRGEPRPVDGDSDGTATCDIGAYEASPVVQCTTDCYVDDATGDDANGGTSGADAKKTIQAAVDQVDPGGTVHVATGTYTGTGDEVVLLDKDVTLSGGWDGTFTTQSGTSTIDGEGSRRGMTVNSGVTAIVEHFVVQNGSSVEGGGIYNHGTLTLTDSTVSDNTVSAADSYGGGIYNHGTLTLTDSTVSGNTASSSEFSYGGGIHNHYGTLTLTDSTVSGNTASINENSYGGGISNHSGTLTLNNSTVSGNTVSSSFPSYGGGIYNYHGTLTLTDSTVTGNTASSINEVGNGGGIYSSDTTSTVTLTNSAVNDNSAHYGGGSHNSGGTLMLTNSTVTGNTASSASDSSYGGGIYSSGATSTVTLTNGTLSDNSADYGGGIVNSIGSATLKNTIVANSPSGGNCYGSITSSGHNLDSGNTCGFSGPGDLINTDPLLGPLQDNGGPTETHALLPGSPAIDAGDDSACPATDQRGVPRPQGDQCDIGAYEVPSAVCVDDDWTGPENCGGHIWGADAFATIQEGIDAVGGSTVYVATGTYTGTGDEVVLLDKDVTLSGGWDGTFTTQSGTSTIDGEDTRRGMIVDSGVTAIVSATTVPAATAAA
jgi:hypothetical protein